MLCRTTQPTKRPTRQTLERFCLPDDQWVPVKESILVNSKFLQQESSAEVRFNSFTVRSFNTSSAMKLHRCVFLCIHNPGMLHCCYSLEGLSWWPNSLPFPMCPQDDSLDRFSTVSAQRLMETLQEIDEQGSAAQRWSRGSWMNSAALAVFGSLMGMAMDPGAKVGVVFLHVG